MDEIVDFSFDAVHDIDPGINTPQFLGSFIHDRCKVLPGSGACFQGIFRYDIGTFRNNFPGTGNISNLMVISAFLIVICIVNVLYLRKLVKSQAGGLYWQ